MKSRMNGTSTIVGLIVLLLVIFVAIGWVMNIVDIVHMINLPLTGLTILRFIGIVIAPLGAVMGWFF